MLNKRASGVLLHVSSLPNPYGIGTFGESAYEFVDFLKNAKQQYWQVLPLNPTGYGDSPYQSCSCFALNPYFIDLDYLRRDGLLEFDQYAYVDFGQDLDSVDYGALYNTRYKVLRQAFDQNHGKLDISDFVEENAHWLPDFALFMAVKSHFNMLPVSKWPDEGIRTRKPASIKTYRELLGDEVEFQQFLQYLAYKQWAELKLYAAAAGIKIIGDIPIYCAEDSVELWVNPKLFKAVKDGAPTLVAGTPPDFYSETGQLWGNPVYDWGYHEKTGFEWWIGRVRHQGQFFDVIRVDHFRGFEAFWEIPAGSEDASFGKWVKGPADKFVAALTAALPDLELIAEDLGDLDETCREFFVRTGLPGMKIVGEAFNGGDESEFLPHNIPKNCIAYTSTHDSPTFMDFFHNKATDEQRQQARAYLRLNEHEGLNWGAVAATWGCPAIMAIAPMQDLLGLGGDARMNTPAVAEGNWQWRVRRDALNPRVEGILAHITKTFWRAKAEKKAAVETAVESEE